MKRFRVKFIVPSVWVNNQLTIINLYFNRKPTNREIIRRINLLTFSEDEHFQEIRKWIHYLPENLSLDTDYNFSKVIVNGDLITVNSTITITEVFP